MNQTKLVKSIQKEDNLNTTKGLIQGNTIQRTEVDFPGIGHYACNCQEHNLSGDKGVLMRIQFIREPAIGHKIGFVQIVKSKTKKGRKWKSEKQHGLRKVLTSSKGYRIDSTSNNPVYGTDSLDLGKDINSSRPHASVISIGVDEGMMVDKPQRGVNKDSYVKFITRAIDLDSKKYLGAITWGFSIISGDCVIKDVNKYMMPSRHSNRRDFNSAIKTWNKLKMIRSSTDPLYLLGALASENTRYSGLKGYPIEKRKCKLCNVVNLPTEIG